MGATAKRVGGIGAVLLSMGCGGGEAPREAPAAAGDERVSAPMLGVSDRVASVEGLSGPEAVRYDPDQDVWFVANFNGDGDERDGNGFVARVSAATDQIDSLRFATGTAAAPLHAPRGMTITGDTLWVVDIDGLHGFDRRTGEHLSFVDLSGFEPGFLNDVVQGPDAALYITDTGRSALYRISEHEGMEVLADTTLGGPNGVTYDPAQGALVLVPWQPGHRIHVWTPLGTPAATGPEVTAGRLDGVEPLDGGLLVASQSDSTLHLLEGGAFRPVVRVGGAPADIGIDTRRRRVAVPYISLNRVDIWVLPPG